MTSRRPHALRVGRRPVVARLVAACCVAVLGAVSSAQVPARSARIALRDITADAGITFTHHAAPEKKYIVESMSGGVALFDFDNDGLTDIYFVDSLTVETANDPRAARSELYRNLGKGRFENVTDKSGLAHPGWGMGVCTADLDGDGLEDVYVTALGGNKLYRNNRKRHVHRRDRARRDGGRLVSGLRVSPTTTRTATSICSSAGMSTSIWRTCRSSARTRRASTAASRCSADRVDFRANRTSCFATTATGRSLT